MTRRQLLRLGAAVAVAPSLPVPPTTVRMGDWDVHLPSWQGHRDWEATVQPYLAAFTVRYAGAGGRWQIVDVDNG